MTSGAWVFLVVAAVFAVGNWIAVARGTKPLEYVCKPATLAALVGVALTLDPVHSDVRAWFVAALVLSLAGDVFLMLPGDRFIPGLISFLLGHIAYVVGLNLHGGSAAALVAAALPVLVVAGFLGRRFLAAADRDLAAPLVAYMLVISAMVTSAWASGNALAAAGATSFFASDGLIAETRFVRPRRWAPVTIMVTYHVGQALLVVSLVR